MFVRINFPVTIQGFGRVVPKQIVALTGAEAVPLIATGHAIRHPGFTAATQDDDDYMKRLKEKARRKGQRVDWDKDPKAPKRPRSTVTASAPSYYPPEDTESFGTKLRNAVKERAARNSMSRQQHDEYVERERNRYRPLQRRERTQGE
jgi:hypothetical protein